MDTFVNHFVALKWRKKRCLNFGSYVEGNLISMHLDMGVKILRGNNNKNILHQIYFPHFLTSSQNIGSISAALSFPEQRLVIAPTRNMAAIKH